MDKEKLKEMQINDQNLYNLAAQKQTFQSQLMEIESALSELEKTDSAYKIVGNLMVKTGKEELKNELNNKASVVSIRIKNIERQEDKLKERSDALRKDISKEAK